MSEQVDTPEEVVEISPPSSPTAAASGSGRRRAGGRDGAAAAGDRDAGDRASGDRAADEGDGNRPEASGSTGRSFTRPPTERRKTSAVWDHYEVCEDDSSKAKCKHCDKKVGAFSFALPCFGGEN